MGAENEARMVEWVGALHMHSTYSDGRAGLDTIVQAAHSLGLDFCILTDHDDMSALPDQGYVGDTLFLVGSEITCSDDSHCLALGIPRPIPRGLTPQQTLDAIHQAHGLSILAHPFDRGSPRFGTYYPWRDWSVTGFTGLEMWNFLVNWGEGVTNLAQAAVGYLFPLQRLTGPNPDGLAYWDELNRDRFEQGEPPVPIIGGVDAHGYFSYRRSLATIRTHLWGPAKSRQLPTDQHTIFRAIRTGRTFLTNDALHDARGFVFRVTGTSQRYPLDAPDIRGPAQIVVSTPKRATIRILYNGEVVHSTVDSQSTYKANRPGTYRCEVTLPWMGQPRPWIYSNAVHVRIPT